MLLTWKDGTKKEREREKDVVSHVMTRQEKGAAQGASAQHPYSATVCAAKKIAIKNQVCGSFFPLFCLGTTVQCIFTIIAI